MSHHLKGIIPKTMSLKPCIASPSTLVQPRLVTIMTNWIDRNDSNVLSFNNKHRFNLIYLKSRDGLNYRTFHDKCDGQGPFVIFIKVGSKKSMKVTIQSVLHLETDIVDSYE